LRRAFFYAIRFILSSFAAFFSQTLFFYMNKFIALIILSSFSLAVIAQNVPDAPKKDVQVKDIWATYSFFAAGVSDFNFMKNGLYYTELEGNDEGAEIVEYNLGTGLKTRTLHFEKKEAGLNGYEMSADEKKLLLEMQTEKIYRYSSQANFSVLDIETKQLTPVSTKGKQRYASFNPTADKVAFVRKNNIFISDLKTKTEAQITTDGKINELINGASDWVYEEEFAISKAFFWSKDGKKIAYLKFNEKEVKEFRLTYFNNNLYPDESVFKYPKAGEKNAIVTAHIYDLSTKKTLNINLNIKTEHYLPRLTWTNDNNLCITQLNRLQNELNLFIADAKTGKVSTLLSEKSDYFINMHDDLRFLENGDFVWASDKDGFNHLYLYNKKGEQIRCLTTGEFDVTATYGVDEKNKKLYFQRAPDANTGAIRREICVTDLNTGKIDILQGEKGVHEVQFSKDFAYYIHNYSNANTPNVIKLLQTDSNKVLKVLEDNKALAERLNTFNLTKQEFLTVKNNEGTELNTWQILPPNFDKNKKYPVFMIVYGGPSRQTVLDEYDPSEFAWAQLLAQKGYIVVSVDNRGTEARGEKFRKSTYLQLGKYEAEDQIAAAKYLATLPYVDKNRIGIFGWSFGGYLSTLCLEKGADIFKLAIAVAPVIHWKWYDSIYTERYMRQPSENKEGYEQNSPLNFANLIKGKYLLVHGTGDDNVHAQNAFEMARVLVEKNIDFEQFYYTNKSHGISGGATRLHLYNKMTNFVINNL